MKNISHFIAVIIIFSVIECNFAFAMDTVQPQQTSQETGDARTIKMTVYEDDFNRLAEKATGNQLRGLIKNATVRIFDGFVEVTAVAQKPIIATLFVRAQINVANNKLYPKILKTRYGFLPIPNFLMNFLIGKLVGQNSQNFQDTGVEMIGIEWRSVDFQNGKATIEFNWRSELDKSL